MSDISNPPRTKNHGGRLEPHRDQIEIFIEALFCHASKFPEGWVAVRSFYEEKNKPFRFSPTSLKGGLRFLIDVAVDDAGRAAQFPKPIVFAPPVALFHTAKSANEDNVLVGLSLSVELDSNVREARARLEAIFGPPTLVVRSGGRDEHGEDRLHLHWRLKEPAKSADDQALLRRARKFATNLIGGDKSGVPLCHPYRWPGSWHRKGEPRLCEIVESNCDVEIDLKEFAEKLTAESDPSPVSSVLENRVDGGSYGGSREAMMKNGVWDPFVRMVRYAVGLIPNDHQMTYADWIDLGMSICYALYETQEGQDIFVEYSRRSPKYDQKVDTVKTYRELKPRGLLGWRRIHWLAAEQDPFWWERWWDAEFHSDEQSNNDQARDGGQPKSDTSNNSTKPAAQSVIVPVDLWGQFTPPPLPTGLLPAVIEEFALEQGELMGADPGGLAVSALVVSAAALPDSNKLRAKKYDLWVEAARLWASLVGPPSTKKTPIILRASGPLTRIDVEMFRDYMAAKQHYDAADKDAKRHMTPPRQVRLRLEDTTYEGAVEVLKESPEGVLLLRDELAGWLGSMDKYGGARGASADRAFWLQSYNGGPYASNRVSRGSALLENLSVSILGGITPDVARKMLAETVDDGLIQRVIPIMVQPGTLSKDRESGAAAERYNATIERLHRTLPEATPSFPLGQPFLCFDDGAMAIRAQLEQKHIDLMNAESFNKRLAAHIGKYDGIFVRLCLLWYHLENENGEGPVNEHIAQRVADFMHGFLLPHASAFYVQVLGLADDHDRLAAVAGYVLARNLTRVTNRDIQHGDRTMRGLKRHEVEDVFNQLEALGWLNRIPGYRPSDPPRWEVNPEAHRRFTDRAVQEAARRKQQREMIQEMFKGRQK